ncbi:filamin-A-like [Oratosquilla oratoria]|uniref:filamin-A-like n=1 Tax=Oratosquilla oratoria TaxID=337810 RepID=UPI003F760620
MASEEEAFRMNHAGLLARSAQGHAAKGMKIKDQEDMWVSIQHHTFRNWVNVQLRDTGIRVEDLGEDLRDGVALVTLVEILQNRRLRKVKRVLNQHQALENVTTALNAISDDGIKLVNIGNVDIVNGNLKLILGLIWSLIMHYQIGKSKFPPKKLMLAWLKAVLPDCSVNNFTSDWNSGVYLSALLDYCRPGLCNSWKTLDPYNSIDNCKNAMEIAKKEFNIPMLLEPEYLASPYLDDLSGMTYLSYFMKEGAPGYKATLEWVQKTLPDKNITNFTSDWNDGTNLASLVKKLGGPVPGYKNLSKERPHWESNLQLGIDGGRRLGVEPVLSASDMARTDVEHLGVMGYIAYYQWLRPRKSPGERLAVKCDLDNVRVNNPVPFRIDFLTKDVVLSEVTVQVTGPSGPVRVDLDLGPRGGSGVFVPEEVGMYELNVLNEDEPVDGSPFKVRALPNISKIMFSGIDPCALGSIVEVLINSNGAGGGGIDVIAHSPTNRQLECPVKEEDGVYAATFQPDEAGEWSIAVAYDDEHIQGSPFTCHVYDPHALKVRNLDKGPTSEPGKPFTVLVDASGCGWGEAKIDITHGGRSVPSKVLEIERGIYEVTFTPLEAGKHKVYTYFNGHEVKGSPHSLYLGVEKPPERKDSKSKKKKSKENREAKVKEKVKEYSSTDLINNSPRHNSSSNYDSSSKFTSSINKSFESSINKTSGYDTRDSPSRDSNRISYESSPSPPSKLRSSIVDSNYRNDSYDSSYKKTSKYESSSSILKSSIVDSTYDRSPSSTPIKYEPALQKSSALDTSLNRSSNYDSSFNSTFNTSLNSSTSTVINSTSNVNKSSSVFKTSSTALNSSSSSSTSRLASPRSPPPPPIKPSTDRRSVSPPAQVPDSMSNLSSPAKVLQIAQNSAKNSEGTSFYYSSVANMKILPSTY